MTSNTSKTLINSKGEIIFFGLQHFLNDIANGDCCFICGANPKDKEFNDEHIIPDWILRKYNLHKEFITLPNGTKYKYDKYKVPCCKECNTQLGETYEKPIRELLNKSYEELVVELEKNPKISHLLFRWLCLMFLKTHLKDKSLLAERDRRKDEGFLADNYYWEDMHHIHCITRSHFTNAKIENNVYGSTFILPALAIDQFGGFDFIDSQTGKTIMIQLGEIVLIATLNDSCAASTIFMDRMMKIKFPVSPFQLREIVAHLNFINLSLKERPEYMSNINEQGEYKIQADLPETLSLLDEKDRFVSVGKFLRYYVEPMIGEIEEKEKILKEIEEGNRGYLFDENGDFIDHSI
ncbi:hypothetical protein [Gillisia sp. CAL575]|uniref:hypothetical protein n=1 Tax=Gillisia sp. CAL575 TaxID=985255 RepID=UPI00039D51ED|nr:hypothetical protein [Gillisia sp. CAL575]